MIKFVRTAMRVAAVTAAAALLGACASSYSPASLTGGFAEKQVTPEVWTVGYYGNGFTSPETVQTYWLYHCAELTLAHGYAGFEVANDITLSQLSKDGLSEGRLSGDGEGRLFLAASTANSMREYMQSQKPVLEGRIRMLTAPIKAVPGRIFDAAALKATLAPHVNDKKCGNNVCPYVHTYLYLTS